MRSSCKVGPRLQVSDVAAVATRIIRGPRIVSSALFAQLKALDWLLRDRETRVARLTEFGAHKIHETFGIDSRALKDSRLAKERAIARRAE